MWPVRRWEYMSVGYICIWKRFFPFSWLCLFQLIIILNLTVCVPCYSMADVGSEGRRKSLNICVSPSYHRHGSCLLPLMHPLVRLYLRWTPPHPPGLILSTVYSNIISGINFCPEMLTLYAVLRMNLIKFSELRSCLYGIWINSKQLIEFGLTQLFFMPGSAGNNSIDSDAELHRCTREPQCFWHDANIDIWTTYCDIMILWFFINIPKLLSLMTPYANPSFFTAIYWTKGQESSSLLCITVHSSDLTCILNNYWMTFLWYLEQSRMR